MDCVSGASYACTWAIQPPVVWQMADIMALMAITNLTAILLLSPISLPAIICAAKLGQRRNLTPAT
jgi:Na+/alanine symporter